MKKTFTLCLTVMMSAMSTMTALADNITAEQARSLAQKFLTGNTKVRKVGSTGSQLTLAKETSDCYIFNCGTDGGYVIVAGDDSVAEPILGWADSGTLDADNLPPTLLWWLSQYEQERKWAEANGVSTAKTAAKAAEAKDAIAPLVEAQWNQGAPFNKLCPIITVNGKSTYTGCVSTAAAQIMHYYKWPTTGTGTASYVWSYTYSYKKDGVTVKDTMRTTLTRDYTESTYDWDNMPAFYTKADTADKVKAEAVARLMVDVGYAVSTKYGSSSSSAKSSDVVTALPKYFGYSSNINQISRKDFDLTVWSNILYDELSEGRPVFYSGSSDDGSHAFVVDGYNDGYFHINWGWGGKSDGYFLLSALNPKDQGTGGSGSGYNSSQSAIIHIKPADSEDVADTLVVLQGFEAYQNAIERTDSFSFLNMNKYLRNRSNMSIQGCVGFKILDKDGNFVKRLMSTKAFTIKANNGIKSKYAKIPLKNFPKDATQVYKVYPIWKTYQKQEYYDIAVAPESNQYLLATVDDDKIYFSNPTTTLTATDIEVPEKTFASKDFMVKASLSLTGSEYNDDVYVYTGDDKIGSVLVDVDESHSATYNISCTAPTTPGNYTLVLKDKDGNALADAVSYTVLEASEDSVVFAIKNVEIVSTSANELKVKVTLECKSGYYSKKIFGYIFGDGTTSQGSIKSATTTIWSGETMTVELDGPFAGEVGKEYRIYFYYYTTPTTTKVTRFSSKYTFTLSAATTGIDGVALETENDAPVYNINGQLVGSKTSQLGKGVYVKNGKKFVVR